MLLDKRPEIFSQLQSDILRLQRFCPSDSTTLDVELGTMQAAFPNGTFPLGAVHEFLSDCVEDSAATSGFVGGIISSLIRNNGATIWISASRMLFPPSLKMLGINPDRFIFLDLKNEKDVFWAMNEALKCGALSAVVGEMSELSFTESRRLQLAVEQSKVTGFVLRSNIRKLSTTACVSRWKITALHTEPGRNLPGIGFQRWNVEILRMRNGKTGTWMFQWQQDAFVPIEIKKAILATHPSPNRKTG